MINVRALIKVLGIILITAGGLMLTAIPFSLHYESDEAPSLAWSAGITISLGLGLWFLTRKTPARIGKREGYLVVVLGWLAMATVGMLPYLLSATTQSVASAFFESMSGFTTTGATVLSNVEAVAPGILFWRSLTQWIGGMGIVVLTVAIFPLLGIGGVGLFVAEAPGPVLSKIHPRVKETAKRLWLIYIALTCLLLGILWLKGLTFFDAINHAMTTMATGGFSTRNASVGDFGSGVQYIILIFMLVAGINYTVIYFGLKGNVRRVWGSEELRTYLLIIALLAVVTTLVVDSTQTTALEESFRMASFQVVSIVTTTGFITADYTSWTPAMTFLFFLMLFIGGCGGSTSGGLKTIRLLVLAKNTIVQFRRLLHPRGVIRIKIDGEQVAGRVLIDILVFLIVYGILFVAGSLVMTAILSDYSQPLLTSMGSVATALGNVGPGIGDVGPQFNFCAIPTAGKWVLSFLMLLGRLELFTGLILFMPYFWRMT